MNDQVMQYAEKHRVTAANNILLFRDWKDFLNVLFTNHGRVAMIVWYEYCKINEQQIGMGGYIDKEHQDYMWAETQIFETDLQSYSLNEIMEYIVKTIENNACYNLYPEFYIC